MNLTLYLVTPSHADVRLLYVLAPDPVTALHMVRHYVPCVQKIEAVANNAYVGELFPRFIEREEPPEAAPC